MIATQIAEQLNSNRLVDFNKSVFFSRPYLENGDLIFDILNCGNRDQIRFSVPSDFHFRNDCAAACLATLCGKAYDRIVFGFPISRKCRRAIRDRTQTKVRAIGLIKPRPRRSGKNIGLNFSGGFDSMAAYYLAPSAQKTISVDFGGSLTRERKFFETLSPDVICATNFRVKNYARHDWLFMGAVSILYADYLDLDAIGFGTIFEATSYNYRETRKETCFDLFESVGLKDATLTRGLTEFATAMIMRAYAPQYVDASIASLADSGTEKRFRKNLLIDTVRFRDNGGKPNFEAYDYPLRRVAFGNSYSLDFLNLMFAKLYGKQVVSKWVDGLEKIDDDELDALNVDWIFKHNPLYKADIPVSIAAEVSDRLLHAGIQPFSRADWRGYSAARSILARFHTFPE